MKKLFIDYEICHRCPECVVTCSNVSHPANRGIPSLKEALAFLFACRRCDNYPCVNSCPNGALAREGERIRRSTALCVSCRTCSLACPFGVIIPDILLYKLESCDACAGNRHSSKEKFSCVGSCPYGALKTVTDEEMAGTKFLHVFGDSILVKAVDWLELYGVKK